jgi:hypothetical protein
MVQSAQLTVAAQRTIEIAFPNTERFRAELAVLIGKRAKTWRRSKRSGGSVTQSVWTLVIAICKERETI